MGAMRYRLRTLLIVLAVAIPAGAVVGAGISWINRMAGGRTDSPLAVALFYAAVLGGVPMVWAAMYWAELRSGQVSIATMLSLIFCEAVGLAFVRWIATT